MSSKGYIIPTFLNYFDLNDYKAKILVRFFMSSPSLIPSSSVFPFISLDVEHFILALGLSVFEVTELDIGIFISIVDVEFTGIPMHESIFESTLLDPLDDLIFRFVVTMSSEIDDTTDHIHS